MKKKISPFEHDIVFQNNSIPSIIFNAEQNIVDINKSALKLLKYTKNEVQGKNINSFSDIKEFSFEINKIKQLCSKKIKSYLLKRRFKDKSGKYLDFSITISLIMYSPKDFFFLGSLNLTKQISPKRVITKKNLENILAKSPVIQWIVDYSTKETLYENINLLEYLGYTAQDFNEDNQYEFYYTKYIADSLKSNIGKNKGKEYAVINKKGEETWFYSESISITKNSKGEKVLGYGMAIDITERKKNESLIEKQKLYIENIHKITPEFLFIYNIESKKISYNNGNCKSTLGYSLIEFNKMLRVELIHPDFIDNYLKSNSTFFESTTKKLIQNVVLLKHKTKGYLYYKIKTIAYNRGVNKKPVKVLKTIENVNTVEINKIKLKNQSLFIKTISKQLPINIQLFDYKTKKNVYSNYVEKNILGYTKKEYENLFKEIVHKDFHNSLKTISKKLKNKINKYYHLELKLKHKTKGYRWYKLSTIVFERDKTKKPSQILEILEDIHEKKNNQLLILEKDLLLKNITRTIPEFIYLFNRREKKTLYSNNRCLETIGYNEDEYFKLNKEDLYQKEDFKRLKDYIKRVSNSKSNENEFSIELLLKHKSKGNRWYRVTTVVFKRENEKPTQFIETIKDIHEYKLDKIKLQDQKNFVEKVSSSSPNLILIQEHKTNKIIYSNYNNRKYFGYSEDEWTKNFLSYIRPNCRNKYTKAINKLKATKTDKAISVELLVYIKNSKPEWLRLIVNNFKFDETGNPTHIMKSFIHIDESKKAFEKIVEQQNMIEKISSMVPEFIYLIDLVTKKYLFNNNKSKNVLGYSSNEFLNIPKEQLFKKNDFKRLKLKIKKNFKSKIKTPFTFEIQIKHKTKGFRWYNINSIIFETDNNNRPIKILDTLKDIDDEKQLQIQLLKSQKKLDTQVKQLEEQLKKNIELEKFASIASHDLKEPLRVVRNFIQILKQNHASELTKDAKEIITFIENSTIRMNELVNGILTFARINNIIDAKEINLNKIFQIVIKDLSKQIENKNCTITCSKLPTIKAHEILIRQLFQNLIGNAIKFSNKKNSKVSIGVRKEKKKWVFFIKDN